MSRTEPLEGIGGGGEPMSRTDPLDGMGGGGEPMSRIEPFIMFLLAPIDAPGMAIASKTSAATHPKLLSFMTFVSSVWNRPPWAGAE